MEELFDNIFVLVPVALLIFLRVFSDGARKRGEKAKKPATAATPASPSTMESQGSQGKYGRQGRTRQEGPKAASREKPTAGQALPARQTRPAGSGLFGRLRNYFSGTLDQPPERQEPLHFEEEAARRLGQFRTQATASPGSAPQQKPVHSGYKEGLPGAMEQSAAITREPAVRYALPEGLARLSPLKRAIVLSEVLGKPKSAQ